MRPCWNCANPGSFFSALTLGQIAPRGNGSRPGKNYSLVSAIGARWTMWRATTNANQPRRARITGFAEVASEIKDETTGELYPLRWVFSWNSSKAELDARQRREKLEAGAQALQKSLACWASTLTQSRQHPQSSGNPASKRAEPRLTSPMN